MFANVKINLLTDCGKTKKQQQQPTKKESLKITNFSLATNNFLRFSSHFLYSTKNFSSTFIFLVLFFSSVKKKTIKIIEMKILWIKIFLVLKRELYTYL